MSSFIYKEVATEVYRTILKFEKCSRWSLYFLSERKETQWEGTEVARVEISFQFQPPLIPRAAT